MDDAGSGSRAEVVDRVARALLDRDASRPVRVAIDGITAAGKTTFADELASVVAVHGRPTARISMDGFHQPRAIRYRQGRESAAGYYEDAYDFASLRRCVLDSLGSAGDRSYRTAVRDLESDLEVVAPATNAPAELVVIVDGSFLQRGELTGGWDVVIYLDCSFEAARARGVARDSRQLGSSETAERLFEIRYHAAQRRYLSEWSPAARADIVIDNDDPRRPKIIRLTRT